MKKKTMLVLASQIKLFILQEPYLGLAGGGVGGGKAMEKKYKVSTGIADQTLHSAGTLPWSWAASQRIDTSHKNTKATLKCRYEALRYVGTNYTVSHDKLLA